MRAVVMTVLRVYQKLLSPILPPACRFTPTCSEYAYQSIDRFGVARGAYLAGRRVLRCHPWHAGGQDPVPEK
jgi:putative membrane protein insertion efficiency factor